MLRTLGPKPGCPEVCELLPEIHGDRLWRRGETPQATVIGWIPRSLISNHSFVPDGCACCVTPSKSITFSLPAFFPLVNQGMACLTCVPAGKCGNQKLLKGICKITELRGTLGMPWAQITRRAYMDCCPGHCGQAQLHFCCKNSEKDWEQRVWGQAKCHPATLHGVLCESTPQGLGM